LENFALQIENCGVEWSDTKLISGVIVPSPQASSRSIVETEFEGEFSHGSRLNKF